MMRPLLKILKMQNLQPGNRTTFAKCVQAVNRVRGGSCELVPLGTGSRSDAAEPYVSLKMFKYILTIK